MVNNCSMGGGVLRFLCSYAYSADGLESVFRKKKPTKAPTRKRYHFGICALENVTQHDWEVFIAVLLGLCFWEPPQVFGSPFWYWGSNYSFLRQESDWPSLARYLSTATVFRQGPNCLPSLKLKGKRFLKIGPPTQKERICFQRVFSRKSRMETSNC